MKGFLKRITCFIATFALALSIPVTAFADNDYSITVESGNSAVTLEGTYKAYKVMNVTSKVSSDPDKTDFSANTYQFTDAFKNFSYDDKSGDELLTEISGRINTAEFMHNFASELFAYAVANNAPSSSATVQDGKAVINLDSKGYYLVASEDVACGLIMVNGKETMSIKFDTPSLDKKIEDGAEGVLGTAAGVGSTITFKVNSFVPNMSQFNAEEGYKFIVHDSMSNGLVPVHETDSVIDVKVTIDGNPFEYFTVESEDAEEGKTAFKVIFNAKKFYEVGHNKVGSDIVISYSAVVSSALMGDDPHAQNTAKLEYSNDPYSETPSFTPDKSTHTYSLKIQVHKVGHMNKECDSEIYQITEPLSGAEFKLYKLEGDVKKYYKLGEDGIPQWDDNADNAMVKTTNEDGNFDEPFSGLEAGTYYLEETKAPEGFNILTEPQPVTIEPSFNEDGTIQSEIETTTEVTNNSGILLPDTGGIGTIVFYALGGVLIVGAAVALIVRRRMKAAQK